MEDKPPNIFKRILPNLNRRYVMLVATSAYWVMTIISWVANLAGYVPWRSETEHYSSACYVASSLLYYVECNGFAGQEFAEFVLGLYWGQTQMLYLIVQGISAFSELGSQELLFFASGSFYALLMWLPLVYPFWYVYTRNAY